MSRSFLNLSAAAIACGLATAPAIADTPVSGVGGLAMSPDGSRLLAITESRALYVLDPATLEIVERHWLRTSPVSIVLSSDGKRIFIRDTSDTLLVMSASDFSIEREIEDVKLMAYAGDANILFVAEFEYDRENRRNDTTLIAIAASSFEELGRVEIDAEAAAIDVTPDAATVAILTDSFDSEAETKESRPSELKGLDREVFDHKHDAEEAQIVMITDSGSTVNIVNTWYSDFSQPTIRLAGGKLWIAPYSGTVAHLDPATGEATLVDTGITYNYGAAFSADGAILLGGGLRDFAVTRTDGAAPGASSSLEKLPGWPEYFESFAVMPDGSFYAGTSAFMVYSFDASGAPVAQAPLF